jgi:hypothetical protein
LQINGGGPASNSSMNTPNPNAGLQAEQYSVNVTITKVGNNIQSKIDSKWPEFIDPQYRRNLSTYFNGFYSYIVTK